MPEQIISATGSQYGLIVNPDGSINATILGSVFIGSVSAHVDSIYVQSGNNLHLGSAWNQIGSVHVSNILEVSGNIYSLEPEPVSGYNFAMQLIYLISGTSVGVTGSEIGSIIKFTTTGSYVQVLTYSNNLITDIGSWV